MFPKNLIISASLVVSLGVLVGLQTANAIVAPQPTCQITVRSCPEGTVSITTNQPGPTNNTKCKKLVGQINGANAPINGSSMGTWGVILNNQIWRYVDSVVTIQTRPLSECPIKPGSPLSNNAIEAAQ